VYVTQSMSVISILITRPQRHRPGSRRLGGSWESCKVQAANQGDNATLLRMAEPLLNQIARLLVGRFGQQEGLYHRLLKMPQPVGGEP
jgi:hypothetical protein